MTTTWNPALVFGDVHLANLPELASTRSRRRSGLLEFSASSLVTKSNRGIQILTPEVTGTHVETKVYRLNFVIDREVAFCHSSVTILKKL